MSELSPNHHHRKLSSGTIWEEQVGYSRAVRVGQWVEVSGTVAVDSHGRVTGAGDPYAQTQFIFTKIRQALIALDTRMEDVIRTRLYLTNIEHWSEVARAHAEVFKEIKPASTVIEVKGLISSEYLVEIEVTAVSSLPPMP